MGEKLQENPLISIILPIYNGETYLNETIGQIKSASYHEWELICVDDGSTDNSAMICKMHEKEDDRIKYIYKENGGVASARNLGLKVANGKYICFCDQDDIISPVLYETMLKDMLLQECEIVITNVNLLKDGNVCPQNSIKSSQLLRDRDKNDLLKWLIMDIDMSNIPQNTTNKTVWNAMFSAELIKNNNIQFRRFVANEDDWIFLIEAVALADKVFLEKESLYTWRIHSKQTTRNGKYVENYLEKRKQWRKFVDSKFQILDMDTEELSRYNIRHFGRLLYTTVNNEALKLANANQKRKIEESVSEIKKAYRESKYYNIRYIPKIEIFKRTKTSYGMKNALIVLLVTMRAYKTAIRLRIKWNKNK